MFAGDISFRVVVSVVFYPSPNSSMLTEWCLFTDVQDLSGPGALPDFVLRREREDALGGEREQEMFFKTLG